MVIGISWLLTKDLFSLDARLQNAKIKPPILIAKNVFQENSSEKMPTISETQNNDTSLLQNIHEIANKVESYKQLPEPDQTWVLENTINTLKAGVLPQEKIQLYVAQLSSLRMHTVLERQEAYVDSTEEFNDFGNEENL